MADMKTLLDRNRCFAEQFASEDLNIRPGMSMILLTCVDAPVAWSMFQQADWRIYGNPEV